MDEFLGRPSHFFIDENRDEIKKCFNSFCYGDSVTRVEFDTACEEIKDKIELSEYRQEHCNINRRSFNGWVERAWEFASGIK
jgi:hypothetical protein